MSEYFKFNAGSVCDTDAKAKSICEQIKAIRDNRDYMIEWYKQQIKKTQEAADFETMGLEQVLRDYFDTVPHKKASKSESYSFPGGKLIFKRQEPEYKKDADTVIDWLKKNGQEKFIKVKEELDWENLKKVTAAFEGHIVTEDGEIVPGIEVIEREPKFVVEV